MGFPGGTSGKEPTCQGRRHKRCKFDPWVGKTTGGGLGNPLHLPGKSQTEEPGRLQSVGSQRARHDWSNIACMHLYSLIEFYSFTFYLVLNPLTTYFCLVCFIFYMDKELSLYYLLDSSFFLQFFKKNIYFICLFIYLLAAPGLSCSM